MSKWFMWIIGISVVAALGVGIYFGLQALEPRTYISDVGNLKLGVGSQNTSETKVDQPLPRIPIPSPHPSTIPPTNEAQERPMLSRATDAETAIYFATSTAREINPSTLQLNLLDVRAHVYASHDVVITERPSATVPTSLWTFNTKIKTLTPIVEKESGLMASWSKNGRFALLFSLTAQSTPALRFIDTTLGTVLPIRFTTLPIKCTVTNEQVMYCGVPKALPPGTILPDDYLKKKIYTDDYVVMIDALNTRTKTVFNTSDPVLDVYNPAVINNALFFLNRYDNTLYKLLL